MATSLKEPSAICWMHSNRLLRESCDYNDRPLRPAAPWHTAELWMFIVVPILDFRNQQGHNSDALLGGEIRSNEASGGHFGHGTRRFREQSETHPLTFSCLRGFLGPPSTRVHGSPFHLVVPVHRPHIFSADGFAFVTKTRQRS